jgi:tight adherence protein C
MIPLVVALTGAIGIALIVVGAPSLRGPRLGRRVDPYVTGIRGRSSSLLARGRREGPVARWIEARWISRDPGGARRLEERLSSAGDDRTAGEFRVEQLTWGLAAAIGSGALLAIAGSAGVGADARVAPILGVLSFECGWLARDWWLGRQVERRRAVLQEELPTAIDMLTLSLMAGESVPAAFARVAGAVGGGIGYEFQRVVADVRAGASAVDALESLKNRLPDYATVRFVDALCTGLERGAPLADVLRAQADDVREARRRRLLELGGKREVLMLVPVVFLIMPVIVVFTLLPGLVSLDLLVP